MSAYAGLALRAALGAIYLFQAYLALFAATPKGLAAYIEKLGFKAHTILGRLRDRGQRHRRGPAGDRALDAPGGSLNAAVLLLGLLTVYVRQGMLLKGTVVDAAIGRTRAGYEYVALLAAATVMLAVGGGGGGSGARSDRGRAAEVPTCTRTSECGSTTWSTVPPVAAERLGHRPARRSPGRRSPGLRDRRQRRHVGHQPGGARRRPRADPLGAAAATPARTARRTPRRTRSGAGR